jgi:hypothetical protein
MESLEEAEPPRGKDPHRARHYSLMFSPPKQVQNKFVNLFWEDRLRSYFFKKGECLNNIFLKWHRTDEAGVRAKKI